VKPEDLGTIPCSRRKTARANPVGKVSALAGAKEVFETIDLGIIHLDIDARILYMNSPAASLLRKPREDTQGMVFWELLPETLVGIFSETFRAAREKKQPVTIETRFPAPMGFRCHCRCLPTSRGCTLVLEDVTDRRRMEEELREIEERYRFHFSYSNDVIYSYDNQFRILSVSTNVERILGYRPEELIGKCFPDLDLLEPEDLKRASKDALTILSGSTIQAATYRFIARDGTRLYGETSGIPLMRDGHVAGVISVARDITYRKQAEEAIRESEEKYRLVVENANEAILVAQNGIMLFVNPKLSEILGCPEEELIGKSFAQFIHPDDREMVLDRHVRRVKGETPPSIYPFRVVDKGGNARWVEINAVKITWQGGPAALNFLTDINERVQAEQDRKKFEEQLAQTQKIEALGSFAGGIAHDLNNFIYPVIINTELLLEEAAPGSAAREILQQTLSAACRQRDLVRQILFFSRRSGPKQSPIQVAPLLEETLNFLRSSIPATVEIRKYIDVPSDTIKGDAAQIQQIIMNLGKNAADSLPRNRGLIEMRLEGVYLDGMNGHPDLKAGRYLRLSVKDDGCGMSREVMGRIFEPFFTTKEVGKGSGMGLPAVLGILKNHGGAITVQSEEGKGSLFSVYLPVADIEQSTGTSSGAAG